MMFRTSLVIALFLLPGCYVPTPYGIQGPDESVMLDKDSFESLRPGESTRTDVLLTLGEPKYRLKKDRFFMYGWSEAYGIIIMAGEGVAAAYPFPVILHYLCLEFGPDSYIVRREHLKSTFYEGTFEGKFSNDQTAKQNRTILRCTKQPVKTE